MDHKDSLSHLRHWAMTKGYHVEFSRDGDDSVDRIGKIISINTTRSLETQVYVMLHECGHILVYENDKVMNFRKIASKYNEKSKIHKVFTVIEEIEAWKRGRMLANRCCIEIDDEKWNRDIARAIRKYMKWALDQN